MQRFWVALLLIVSIRTAPAQTSPNTAFRRLLNVDSFAVGPSGYAGTASSGEKDFGVLLSSPDAVSSFKNVYTGGNLQAKSYALLGLSKLDPDTFKRLADASPDKAKQVVTQAGCIVSHESFATVIKRISDRKYEFFFVERVRKNPLPCEYSGPLMRDFSGALIQYKSDEMKSRATHKQDIDAASKQIDAKGFVFVDVLIDDHGRVSCTKVLSGPPVLSTPIEQALRKWSFAPAEMNGQNVGYTGLLVFALCNVSCGDAGRSMTIVN